MTSAEWIPYCGAAPMPGEWLARWNLDPWLLLAMLGLAAIWRRQRRPGTGAAASGALGLALFLYVSPFCALGSALFTVRIVHDTILATILGPLVMRAFGLDRRLLPGSLVHWTIAHALIFWLWHAPPFYSAAMSSSAIFWTMQLSIVGSAAIWWAKLLRAPVAGAVPALLATMVAMGMLGALLTFAGRAFYAPHWLTTQPWGFSPLEDQQIAGIIMWAPASAVYLFAALALLYRHLGVRRFA